jgi:hypothetical protein|tara:strand:- start:1036 stop:1242 length:207 start_codon:yes stop_codon:yes gene_type:complete
VKSLLLKADVFACAVLEPVSRSIFPTKFMGAAENSRTKLLSLIKNSRCVDGKLAKATIEKGRQLFKDA